MSRSIAMTYVEKPTSLRVESILSGQRIQDINSSASSITRKKWKRGKRVSSKKGTKKKESTIEKTLKLFK